MSDRPVFICECGSNGLAVSHTWQVRTKYEEVAVVGADGQFQFDGRSEVATEEEAHEWIAYCGGCGHGVSVEWLDEQRVKLIVASG